MYSRRSGQDQNPERVYWDAVAEVYAEKILSPLRSDVQNPLFEHLAAIPNHHLMRVIDVGCGTGSLLQYLSAHFKEVWAVDWSSHMLAIAKELTKPAQNIVYQKMDMRQLHRLGRDFDVVCAVNSILSPEPGVIDETLNSLHSVLAPGGYFMAIWPSFEAVMHQRHLTINSYLESGLPLKASSDKADQYFVERNKLNPRAKTYADDGTQVQQLFTAKDVVDSLRRTRFTISNLQRVLYPWWLCDKYGYGFFPGQPEIWDWLSIARR